MAAIIGSMLLIADNVKRSGSHRGEALLCRYLDLVQMGFSRETSSIIAEAPVPLSSVVLLMLPDDVDTDVAPDADASVTISPASSRLVATL